MSAINEYRLLTLITPAEQVINDLELPQDIRGALVWFSRNGHVDVEEALELVLLEGAVFPHSRERMHALHAHVFQCLEWHIPAAWFAAREGSTGWGDKSHVEWLRMASANLSLEELALRGNINSAWTAMLRVTGDVVADGHSVQTHVFAVLANLLRIHEEVAPIFTPNFFTYATTGMTNPYGLSAPTLRWR